VTTCGDRPRSVPGTAPGVGTVQIHMPETGMPSTESAPGLLQDLLSSVEGTRIFCSICYNNSADQWLAGIEQTLAGILSCGKSELPLGCVSGIRRTSEVYLVPEF
jgi:hypothetical protein